MTLTRGQKIERKGKCRHSHCSVMYNQAWTELNKDGTVLKLHDNCSNPRCNCRKQITFTPRRIQMEGPGYKDK